MNGMLAEDIRSLIRNIPDFPRHGIQFKDITTVLHSGPAFGRLVEHFKERYAGADLQRVVGIESRGFVFGAALAYSLGLGLALVRKPGKLPYRTIRSSYELEYGSDSVEIHEDAIVSGERVLLIDDLLATGGTAAAAADLIARLGGRIHEVAFVIELAELKGRLKLKEVPVYSLVTF